VAWGCCGRRSRGRCGRAPPAAAQPDRLPHDTRGVHGLAVSAYVRSLHVFALARRPTSRRAAPAAPSVWVARSAGGVRGGGGAATSPPLVTSRAPTRGSSRLPPAAGSSEHPCGSISNACGLWVWLLTADLADNRDKQAAGFSAALAGCDLCHRTADLVLRIPMTDDVHARSASQCMMAACGASSARVQPRESGIA
jgi:hypothetical protein